MKRFLGVELLGAKNSKTSIAILDYYAKEQKVFLLDIFERIPQKDGQSADQAFMELLDESLSENELREGVSIGMHAALSLPPCVACRRPTCSSPSKCNVPEVKWMRENSDSEITPYTQRPIDIFLRSSEFTNLPKDYRPEEDETFGGARASINSRGVFIKRLLAEKFPSIVCVEVVPKLTVAKMVYNNEWGKKLLHNYRKIETGLSARETLLEKIAREMDVFIYDRDFKKISQSLAAFDAMICALSALMREMKKTEKPPRGYPDPKGFIAFPK